MRWIVDGYNVIRRDPDLASAEKSGLAAGRAALLRLIARATQTSGEAFTVVFDGAPGFGPATSAGRVETVFSRPPERADDVIIALARRFTREAIVVSSDRMVSDASRRAGATAVSVERFVAALGDDPEAPGSDDDDDDEPPRSPKRGNPRRISDDERAVRRALNRLSRRIQM